jgi:hypothetical protein
MTIEQMADEARKTVFQHINRSAGQHSRAMRKPTATLTPSALYAMGMESNTAGDLMHELCKALGTDYPPRADDYAELTGITELQHFIESIGKSAPVTLAN